MGGGVGKREEEWRGAGSGEERGGVRRSAGGVGCLVYVLPMSWPCLVYVVSALPVSCDSCLYLAVWGKCGEECGSVKTSGKEGGVGRSGEE